MLSVSLLQPDVAQNDKFEPAHIDQALAWHVVKLAAAPGQLVVTPESSLPVLPVQIPRETWLAYERPFNVPGKSALVGVFTGDDERGYTNSLVGPRRDAPHDRRHLLPLRQAPPAAVRRVRAARLPAGSST